MSTGELLSCIEQDTAQDPDAAVIVLHGLGADGNDFVPVVDALQLPASLRVRFLFPHAPVRRVTINGGYPMRAWYDIAEADLSRRADLAGVEASWHQVEALIDRETQRGIAVSRIVLAGFSQGGAIALYAGLRHPARLAGVIALSTYLIAAERLDGDASDANRGLPILMAHGTEDTVVRYEWGEASRDALRAAGYPVEWRAYPIGHGVNGEEVAAIGAFLRERL